MKLFAVTSLLVVVVITLASATESVRNDVTATFGKPKCPSVCRIGLNAKKMVRKECKKNKAWCSPKLRKCVMAPCAKIVNGKSWKGWKCVCPACQNKCYGGLFGLKRARKECAVRQCHSIAKPNAPCVLQTCLTTSGRTGFKCACQGKPTTCPDVCRGRKLGSALVSVECSDQNRPICFNTDRRCEIQDCRIGTKPGTKCACPDVLPPRCPDDCHLGVDAGSLARQECSFKRYCRDGHCMVRKCYRNGMLGVKCGCKDEKPPAKCPNTCRFDARANETATAECAKPLFCASAKCQVRLCYGDGMKGYKCGCKDEVAPPLCPNKCLLGPNSKEDAAKECKQPHYCEDGKCELRTCFVGGEMGYKCGCKDEIKPPTCPDKCRFDDGAKKTATTECKEPLLCRSGKCDVRLCYSDGQKGYKCGCKDEVPPPRCPDRCRFDANAKETATGECDRPHLCSDGKCEVRECYGLAGKGYKCGCRDESPPTACPDKCRIDKNAKETAAMECTKPHVCRGGKCDVRSCYIGNLMGYKCGCQDEKPPTSCPDFCHIDDGALSTAREECERPHSCKRGDCMVRKCYRNNLGGYKCGCQDEVEPKQCPRTCRLGRSGHMVATGECDKRPVCGRTGALCKVQNCRIGTQIGFKCDCAVEVPPVCSDTCRGDLAGMQEVADECARKPTCALRKAECELRTCDLKGRTGLECGCPRVSTCSNRCATSKSEMERVRRECWKKPKCGTNGGVCLLQSCRNGNLIGLMCGCPRIRVCSNRCEISVEGIKDVTAECASKVVCSRDLKLCSLQSCSVGDKKGKMCGCGTKISDVVA